MMLIVRDAKSGRFKQVVRRKNIICAAGEAVVAALMNGESVLNGAAIPAGANFTAAIYGAVGTGTGTPANGDTALFSEFARVSCATNSRGGTLVVYTFFFTTSQANGTITEAGVFLLGSSTAGSGYLLDHALLGSTTKNSAETATLVVQFSLN